MKGVRSSGWTIAEVAGGFVVQHRGKAWPMEPRADRQDAVEYAKRLASRYTDESAREMIEYAAQHAPKSRGGPWRYSLPGGESGVVNVSRLSDARALLRRKMGRKRLPDGITWEIAG